MFLCIFDVQLAQERGSESVVLIGGVVFVSCCKHLFDKKLIAAGQVMAHCGELI